VTDTLRTRVGRVISGSLHAILDTLEDQAPEAMMEQAIRNVDDVMADVRTELGKASANRHLAQQQHADLNQRHLSCSVNIETAIAQSREDLARAGVARQLDIEAQLPVLEITLSDLVREESELKGFVDALLARKREMQDALLSYRTSRARMHSPTETSAGASTVQARLDDAADAFDRIYARHTGSSVVSQGLSLEHGAKLRELEELSRNNKIDERLAKLKAARSG
jgi:phage shock protein A